MAHIERRGTGRWRARYRGSDGRERSKTFERRADAERWLAAMEVAKAKGLWVDPALGRCTFAEWTDQWATTLVDLRPSTRDRDLRIVRNHLVPHFGAMQLVRITRGTVVGFISQMLSSGDHASATVRKVGQVLNKVLKSAVEAGLIARSPCEGVRSRPRVDVKWPS